MQVITEQRIFRKEAKLSVLLIILQANNIKTFLLKKVCPCLLFSNLCDNALEKLIPLKKYLIVQGGP